MLEIVLQKEGVGRKRLDMADDATLTMDSTSPYFDDQLQDGTYSLPFEIPFTENNSKQLGAPEMLEGIKSNGVKSWEISVRDDGDLLLSDVKLSLLGHKGDFGYRRGSYVASISGTESLYGAAIAGKTLRDLHLGGTIFTGSLDARDFAANLQNGYFPQYSYINFAPLYWPDFIDESREDYTTEFVPDDIVNRIIFNGSYYHGWVYGAPDPATSGNSPINMGSPGYSNYRSVPFFTLHYVLRKAFEEFGYTLYGDFLEDKDYARLYIFNNFAINIFNYLELDINRYIYPKNHVPDIAISEFLKAIQTTFNLCFVFGTNRNVEVRYKTALLSTRSVQNLTAQTINSYDAEATPIQTSGLKLNWQWDQADSMVGESVKTINYSRVVVSVQLYNDLAALHPVPGFVDGDLAYVIAENNYYIRSSMNWNQYSVEQSAAIIGKGETDISSKISTLVQKSNFVTASSVAVDDICAVRQRGSYYANSTKAVVTSDFGLRLFYITKRTIGTALSVPTIHANAFTSTGVKLAETTLSFSAMNGLYNRHHRRWWDTQLKGWSVKASFLTGKKLPDFGTKVQIKSTQYLIQQLKPTIGANAALGAVLLKL